MLVCRLLTLILFSSISVFAAENPFSGTWRFDPAKAHPIGPIPRSAIAHIEVDGDNFNFSQEYVGSEGETTNARCHAKLDGKEYAVFGDPNTDVVSLQRVNERKINFTFKKSGKLILTMQATISKDGDTATFTYTDYTSGKPHNGSSVYDRQ